MIKLLFDIISSAIGFILLLPILFSVWLIACIDTNANGIFLQLRIGQC